MAEAGYNPESMLDVMKILKEASGGQHPPEFLATHPLPETRLAEIREELKQEYPEGNPVGPHDGSDPADRLVAS